MPPNEPPPPEHADASRILSRAAAGDADAARALLPLVYDQLRAAAARAMFSERAGHTLQATALVHEAYLKLIGPRRTPWTHRRHFYAAAADAMRQILIDHARARNRRKRGGGATPIHFDDALTLSEHHTERQPDFVALDHAIRRLEVQDPRAAQVVRLKFYAGLTMEQIALAEGLSVRTVKNDWAFARAWLERALRRPEDSP